MDIKRYFRKILPISAIWLLLLGGLGISGQALATTELRMGFYQAKTHMYIKVAEKILPELEQKTQGRYKFGVYPSEVLGKAAEQLDLTNRGLVFANFICTCYYPGTYPLFNIETLPIWSEGLAGVEAAYKGGLNKIYSDYLHSKGMTNVEFLGIAGYGMRAVGTKKKEVRSPKDFKGLRIRALGLERVAVQKNGGSVISVAAPGVYEALQRHMIDGAHGNDTNWIDWKWQEQSDYMTLVDLTTAGMSTIYSISDMNKIPEADRKIVLEVLNKFNEAITSESHKYFDEARIFLTTKWKGKAFPLTREEKRAWIKDVEAEVINQFMEKVGDVGLAQKALDVARKFNP